MANKLAEAASPYLLQHKDNPVNWYPWGEEALQRAKELDRPIFLSVGYAACHWCHVMEHESFEDSRIAELLNRWFVSIKVDREERPDIDQIYMNAVQMMTGSGGWPMSVFLTPDQRPIYGGTYWPPTSRMGRAGFDQVLQAVAEAWENRRQEVLEQAGELTQAVVRVSAAAVPQADALDRNLLDGATQKLKQAHDAAWGGFGSAPKFPHAGDIELCLRVWDRSGEPELLQMVRTTLDKMAAGGIYDHVGGGFARYSVDARWLVPHFEKMLYDNGLLAAVYTRAYQATHDARYRATACETLEYLQREMRDPAGGIHSSEDADSEGVEGKYYVWTPDEVIDVLGPTRGERFNSVYDITAAGNFEGHNIPNLPQELSVWAENQGVELEQLTEELAEDRQKLRQARDRRVHPGRDDKVLCSWNALAIESFALAARVFDRADFLQTASGVASFLCDNLRRDDGRLLHSWRQGKAQLDAYLDDYAYLINALVQLYEASGQMRWVETARELTDMMLEHFSDPQGGFFYSADDGEALIARTKDTTDSSVPSGNSAAALALVRMAELGGHERYLAHAESTLRSCSGPMKEYPTACGHLLCALDAYLGPRQQVVLSVADASAAERLVTDYFDIYRPRTSLIWRVGSAPEPSVTADLVRDRPAVEDQPTLYVCENRSCAAPLVGEGAVRQWLAS